MNSQETSLIMDRRLHFLSRLPVADIDAAAEKSIQGDADVLESILETTPQCPSNAMPGWTDAAHSYLPTIQDLSDFELVRLLRCTYDIRRFPSDGYSDPNLIISKVNHGYWEHLAFLNAQPEHRSSYRDVGLNLRRKQYLSTDFMNVLVQAMLNARHDSAIKRFVSTTTGVLSFADNLGAPWTGDHRGDPQTYTLSPFKRGAVRGLMLFAHLASTFGGGGAPLVFFDSFENNKAFEDGLLLGAVCGSADPGAVCLVMGPPHLARVRLAGWPGQHAFLAVSKNNAMAQWRFNTVNLMSVLFRCSEAGRNVVVLFQGAVLGPVIAMALSKVRHSLRQNIAFLDLGRLLDTAYDQDISDTGSPLPSRASGSGGQIILGNDTGQILQHFW